MGKILPYKRLSDHYEDALQLARRAAYGYAALPSTQDERCRTLDINTPQYFP